MIRYQVRFRAYIIGFARHVLSSYHQAYLKQSQAAQGYVTLLLRAG